MTDSAPAQPEAQDHPDGEEIRRQVEYYFSDENLPTDFHLLQFCGGRQNLPVSINRITGFKRMRKFKPKTLVVAALRKSSFLEVSEDGKTIKRKVPFQGKCALDSDFLQELDDDEIAYDPRQPKPLPRPFPSLQQIPAITVKNKEHPTGFEDGYVEAPLQPEEVAEEEDMYDPECKSFIERMEIAIQRFKQRRRMRPEYAQVFELWMRFGGVECGPRMFGAVSKEEMKSMSGEEIARALATHNIPWDRQDEKNWVVDFVAVGEAFLSSCYPARYSSTPGTIKRSCQVLRSFYNYLLYHSVCPEYSEQLQAARAVCDQAESELPKVRTVGLALPGDFNKSASVIFGGSHAGLYTGNQTWAEEMRTEGMNFGEIGMRDEEARVKFNTGLAFMGSDEQQAILEATQGGKIKIIKDESMGLEVVAVHQPEHTVKELYDTQSASWKQKIGRLEPLGRLICKAWHAEDADEWDLPQDKYTDGKPFPIDDNREFEFWMEESILAECFSGMKMHARVLTIEGNLTILDQVSEVMCSFYRWLPNELWMDSKSREVKWLNKEEEGDDGDVGHGEEAAMDDDFDDVE